MQASRNLNVFSDVYIELWGWRLTGATSEAYKSALLNSCCLSRWKSCAVPA